MSMDRRDFLRAGATGLAGTAVGGVACRTAAGTTSPQIAGSLAGVRSATPAQLQNLVGDGRKRRILLRGGVVLSLDPKVGDFASADVLIDGTSIAAIGPNLPSGDAEIVDCAGTIVMPGFITTHSCPR